MRLREDSSMESDPPSTDRQTSAMPHDADRPATSGSARTHPYPAVAVVVTIALVSALLFGALSARRLQNAGPSALGPITPTVGTHATTPPSATPTPQPLPADMSVVGVAMVSASDGWAIAAPTASSSALAHYTGGRWMLSGDTYTGVSLTDIAMDAHNDGWAVGAYADQTGGVVLHYSSGRWDVVRTPAMLFAGVRVWAFSPSQALVLAA